MKALFSALLIATLAAPAVAAGSPGVVAEPDLPPPDRVEASLYFFSEPGDYIGGGAEVTLTERDGAFTASFFIGAVTVSFHGAEGESWWNLVISAPDGSQLLPGTYENTRRWPFNGNRPGLDFTGNGRGCNESTGRFDLLELVSRPDGKIERLAVDFEQHCDGGPALFGQLRYRLAGAPSPPPGSWLTSEELPGYRVKARISTATRIIPGGAVDDCIADTLCVSGAVAGRAELFIRILGPRANGYLWPTLTRFTPSQVEVWIEQISSGEVNYYFLPSVPRENPNLPGVVDRTGFTP